MLVALALFSNGRASTGGLVTPSANEVLVLQAASNGTSGNKSGGNRSNSSGGNGSGGNKSGGNNSGGNSSGGNGSGGNTSGGNGSGSNSSNGTQTACSPPHGGCLVSKCCTDPNYRCYKKNDQWAQCRTRCQAGIDPYDQGSDKKWSCEDWEDNTTGKCAGAWEACLNTKCCREKNQRCFKKNDLWAQCRDSCAPGIDPLDQATGVNVTAWSCIKFDKTPALPMANCSIDNVNCFATRCCKNATSTCFKKDGGYAACRSNCTKDFYPLDPPEHRRKWVCDQM